MAAEISKEYDVILDAENGLVGEARMDVVTLDIMPLEKSLRELEKLAEELLSSLNPASEPLFSRPLRGGIYRRAGLLTNIFLGFLIGCLFFAIIIFTYLAVTSPEALKAVGGG
ncbi:tetrahydromethanopterin S-methyltransferase subunit MtrB [Candidatus Hecatella orcuttiae]|jgi:tetrahydromethanopterin S-methyltransferase subunit B|uniref:tetrahydromethanopterin S-methyltransferase subunit MtrB n=1 Tax=Candidatus Hecatella orcuttiae TaxID=1935119 RepID=UPI002867F889|nr:tetrahydromethanopterin S-methyltransferase subunit B [Candidatus Hecatella orcuttiae]